MIRVSPEMVRLPGTSVRRLQSLRARTRYGMLAGLAIVPVALSACGGGQVAKGGKVVIGMFQPFSGPNAPFGPEMQAGCVPAAHGINQAGGVLGHKFSCLIADNRGDPADAVPAAEQLISATSGLAGILGPDSNTASATVPLFNRAHIPMFTDTGQAVFNMNSYQYYWRIFPPDATTGYAMALYAWDKGYRRAAAVFGTDISAQGSSQSVIKAFEALGGKVVLSQSIAEQQTSYRSEIVGLNAAKPQVVFTEASPQTSATYYTELKQQFHMVPIIGTDGTTSATWTAPVRKALGAATFNKYYVGVQAYAPQTGPAYAVFKSNVLATGAQLTKPISGWLGDSFSMGDYDGVNLIALAMLQAKSTDPVVFNKAIPKVAAAAPGAVVVHSFAAGEQALSQGKTIRYIGASGPIVFDQWHNSVGEFEVVASDLSTIVESISGARIQAIRAKVG